MKNFEGKVLFLDRSDINTDEIIPARYLTEISKDALKPHLLEDLMLDGFNPTEDIKCKGAVVTRANFGCGSSREHAPWALEVNGINVVIAKNFARIFRQNMYNCGMLAIELETNQVEELFKRFVHAESYLKVDIEKQTVAVSSENDSMEINFQLEGFDRDLILSGGWVNYVDQKY